MLGLSRIFGNSPKLDIDIVFAEAKGLLVVVQVSNGTAPEGRDIGSFNKTIQKLVRQNQGQDISAEQRQKLLFLGELSAALKAVGDLAPMYNNMAEMQADYRARSARMKSVADKYLARIQQSGSGEQPAIPAPD
jgi:hypothetical protein